MFSGRSKNLTVAGRLALLVTLLVLPFLYSNLKPQPAQASPGMAPQDPPVQGPFLAEGVEPAVFDGSLLDLVNQPQTGPSTQAAPQPLKYTPGTHPKGSSPSLDQWVDPILQDDFVGALMPGLKTSFDGISYASGGSGWPPDTAGDVSETYYVQVVNTSIGMYDKTSGAQIIKLSFNDFFNGTGTACDYSNSGDPVVVYDRFAQRWLITDFSVNGPYFECIAVSKTNDPVGGGWYFYALKISSNILNDYPKVGVWHDSYVISFNMFTPKDNDEYDWGGVQVWALDKSRMLSGQKIQAVSFALSADSGYAALLPSQALSAPPAGSASYLATVAVPNQLLIWKLKPDWGNPALSTFSSTPYIIPVADFASADSVPQPGSASLLDSLSPRPMMQLIYRTINGVESLWLTHSVTNRGVGAMRWYEVRQLAGTPVLFQQGTYQPDNNHRWMGSLAVDKDGNMALGYSVSNTNLFPSIRYTGRLAGELPGQLPQGESVMINGTGSQTGSTRWGDYSAMSVDPLDDCTFWYTTEYYATTGTNWHTRIGSFKFPSCGQPKGKIQGVVRNAVTNAPVAGVQVTASSSNQQMTVATDSNGVYTINLAAGTFSVKAGPAAPGFPNPTTVNNVPLVANNIASQDILLSPVPNLVEHGQAVLDSLPSWNSNGYLEPGEKDLQLVNTLINNGAITSTLISAKLESLTPGVVISTPFSPYDNLGAGQTANNLSPFVFSVDSSVTCGQDIQFRKIITDSLKTYTQEFSLRAGIPVSRLDVYANSFEGSATGLTPEGTGSTWALTDLAAHSASRSWTDSPGGNYQADSDTWLTTPLINLGSSLDVQVSFWAKYALEPGFDYVYLEYSTDGGLTWTGGGNSLAYINGVQSTWKKFVINAPQLNQKPQVKLRFRLVSDAGVEMDGVYIDDLAISYQPYTCLAGKQPMLWLPLVRK